MMFDADSVGDYDNFTTLNYEEEDPYGPWFAGTDLVTDFKSQLENGKTTQAFSVSRTLHQEL